MEHSILIELISTLDILVLERIDRRHYVIIGAVPEWFEPMYPNISLAGC